MKIFGKLLALCVFHPNIWGTTAFLVQTPTAFASKGGRIADTLPPSFSYLGSLGEGASEERAVLGETPNLAARLQALAEPNGVVIARLRTEIPSDYRTIHDAARRYRALYAETLAEA